MCLVRSRPGNRIRCGVVFVVQKKESAWWPTVFLGKTVRADARAFPSARGGEPGRKKEGCLSRQCRRSPLERAGDRRRVSGRSACIRFLSSGCMSFLYRHLRIEGFVAFFPYTILLW